MNNPDPEISTLAQAYAHLENTQQLLTQICVDDEKLTETVRVELGQGAYLELTGDAYINDFLMPNFYFHLVTAYDILHRAGVPIGKRNYMMHLVPFIEMA